MTPEGRVKKEIKAYLDSIGAYYFMPVQTGYGVRGTPDFLVCFKGRFIAIEAKAPSEEPRKFQKLTLARIEKSGGAAFATTDVDGVKRVLEVIASYAR